MPLLQHFSAFTQIDQPHRGKVYFDAPGGGGDINDLFQPLEAAKEKEDQPDLATDLPDLFDEGEAGRNIKEQLNTYCNGEAANAIRTKEAHWKHFQGAMTTILGSYDEIKGSEEGAEEGAGFRSNSEISEREQALIKQMQALTSFDEFLKIAEEIGIRKTEKPKEEESTTSDQTLDPAPPQYDNSPKPVEAVEKVETVDLGALKAKVDAYQRGMAQSIVNLNSIRSSANPFSNPQDYGYAPAVQGLQSRGAPDAFITQAREAAIANIQDTLETFTQLKSAAETQGNPQQIHIDNRIPNTLQNHLQILGASTEDFVQRAAPAEVPIPNQDTVSSVPIPNQDEANSITHPNIKEASIPSEKDSKSSTRPSVQETAQAKTPQTPAEYREARIHPEPTVNGDFHVENGSYQHITVEKDGLLKINDKTVSIGDPDDANAIPFRLEDLGSTSLHIGENIRDNTIILGPHIEGQSNESFELGINDIQNDQYVLRGHDHLRSTSPDLPTRQTIKTVLDQWNDVDSSGEMIIQVGAEPYETFFGDIADRVDPSITSATHQVRPLTNPADHNRYFNIIPRNDTEQNPIAQISYSPDGRFLGLKKFDTPQPSVEQNDSPHAKALKAIKRWDETDGNSQYIVTPKKPGAKESTEGNQLYQDLLDAVGTAIGPDLLGMQTIPEGGQIGLNPNEYSLTPLPGTNTVRLEKRDSKEHIAKVTFYDDGKTKVEALWQPAR